MAFFISAISMKSEIQVKYRKLKPNTHPFPSPPQQGVRSNTLMRPCLRRTTGAILGQALHEPGIRPGYHPVHLHHTVQESGQVGGHAYYRFLKKV